METVNQIILAKSVNIFRRKSSSEQTKQSTVKVKPLKNIKNSNATMKKLCEKR